MPITNSKLPAAIRLRPSRFPFPAFGAVSRPRGGDGDGSVVAAGVGRGGFDDLGVEDVVVRVLRQPLPARTGAADTGVAEQVYDARVRLVGGELQLIKDEAKSELAPLVKPPTPRDAEAAP